MTVVVKFVFTLYIPCLGLALLYLVRTSSIVFSYSCYLLYLVISSFAVRVLLKFSSFQFSGVLTASDVV